MCLSASQIVSNHLKIVNFLKNAMIDSTKPYCSRIAKKMADCSLIPYEIHDLILEAGNFSRFCSQAADSVAKFYFLLNFLYLLTKINSSLKANFIQVSIFFS